MNKSLLFMTIIALATLLIIGGQVFADGTEELGDPSIDIASGSGFVAAGTGLCSQPGSINIDIPAGATVNQVILYWHGDFVPSYTNTAGDDTVMVNGVSVQGMVIGGPTDASRTIVTYRADITGLNGLNIPGINDISGLDFDLDGIAGECDRTVRDDGAGMLVIYDDGSTSDIEVRDGSDFAFCPWDSPLDTTVAQTFSFDPSNAARSADITLFFSSVEGTGSGSDRPNRIIVIAGSEVTIFDDMLNSNDGDEWDTFTRTINIPAGASELTVEAISPPEFPDDPLCASFVWNTAALSVPTVTETGCRFTGGGVDTFIDSNGTIVPVWDGKKYASGKILRTDGDQYLDVERYQFGGQVGANTALPPQPKGEWTHHQQHGDFGSFTFHGGTSSAPKGTEIFEIRCSDPGTCKPSGDPPSPARQLDFDGIGTFRNIGHGSRAPKWLIPDAVAAAEGKKGNFTGTFHWFEVNVDDLGETGNENPKKNPGLDNADTCPSDGFGEKGSKPLADCDCPDFYRITIYNGVDTANVVWLDENNIDPNSLDRTNAIYQVWGYIDGGNLQIHRLTGFDQK